MSLLFQLVLFYFSAAAGASELLFSQVHQEGLTGLSFETPENRDKLRREALAYAHYRKYPKSPRGIELWQNCYENNESHLFCEVVLKAPARTAEPETSKALRAKFFSAVYSLDDPTHRAKNCPKAQETLSSIYNEPAAASLHARSLYWLWRCAKEIGGTTDAARWSSSLIQSFPVAHHTLLVMREDAPDRLEEMLSGQKDWPVIFRSVQQPELNPWIAGIEALMEAKEDGAAAVFGLHIQSRQQTAEPSLRLYLASLMSRVSESIPSVLPVSRVLVPLFQSHPDLISAATLRLLFPAGYRLDGSSFVNLLKQHKGDLDPALLAGLIHQESAINPRAASPAGAFGLTQMLLTTASEQWRRISGNPQAQVTSAMLFDPAFSIQLGTSDLQRRFGTFQGNEILTLASYNAGEAGVKRWQKEVKPISDPQVLMDLLFMNRQPEYHVSQYVQAVLSKRFWYSRLYPDFSPSQRQWPD